MWEQHEFYNRSTLTKEDKISILKDGYINHTKWWVDTLDCNKSWRRQKIEMSFEEIMQKFNNKHFTVIHRAERPDKESHGEIGFCTISGTPEYFLWIEVDSTVLDLIIKEYKLERM